MFRHSTIPILQVFLLAYLCNGQAKELDFKDNCSKYGQICANYIDCSNANELIENKQALPCGFRDTISKKDIKICCNPSKFIPATTSEIIRQQDIRSSELSKSTRSSRNSTAVALQKCQEYKKYGYVKKGQDPKLPSEDSANAQTLIAGGTPAKAKEFPHMAVIGYGKDFKKVHWGCGGSLISEKFIMSAAHCADDTLNLPQWVLLGALNKFPRKEDVQRKVYSIVKVHNHPEYKSGSFYNDISLFQLNTSVKFSPYVRPACLYTSTADFPAKTKASITGWGITGEGEKKTSDRLLKAIIMVVDHQKCRDLVKVHWYDSNTMICAGDTENNRDTCPGDSGGPLQIPIPNESYMWNIIGVSSAGTSCGYGQPDSYTKVSYFLDWIQSIVWP